MKSGYTPSEGRSFRDLITWKKCREVRKAISELVRNWPTHEKYKLVDQILRSSRGPCSNIAEGYGRFYEKENVRFCLIARGSLFETMDHLTTAQDEGYVTNEVFQSHWMLCEEAIRVLNGYINYLERFTSIPSAAEPLTHYELLDGPDPLDAPHSSGTAAPHD